MLKIINKTCKTLLYGMAISAIIDSMGIPTRCDPLKPHAIHIMINEHAINKLNFMYVNKTLVHKETVNELDIVGDEGNDETHVKPNAALSAGPSVNTNVAPNYPLMSTAFDSKQAFALLLQYMESMDARVVSKLEALEA
ncbi:Uncharacterized protein TCM_035721 [Theobroma cacao]|uniref:Uncharacterized protein n=1 Tax=Theobroma cacao TaxID=3641 RepID=A0A061FIV0_THECC|nr:Uncharacterized protein TCM_035721 [Theobroma cacao]